MMAIELLELFCLVTVFIICSMLIFTSIMTGSYISFINVILNNWGKILAIIICIGVAGVLFYLYIQNKKFKKDDSISSYDIENTLAYEQRLEIFKNSLPLNLQAKWKEIEKTIQFLQEKNFYTDVLNETNKILKDIAVKSVINGKVTNSSIKQFENTLLYYAEYLNNQLKYYDSYEKKQLEDVQPYINAEYDKVNELLKIINTKPLDYK